MKVRWTRSPASFNRWLVSVDQCGLNCPSVRPPICSVEHSDWSGRTELDNRFTHHICPHHNVVVVWKRRE